MSESSAKLDLEFKRYLQILRPYLGQLMDEDAINICNAWIKRLSNCSEHEKLMRNRYVFVLCYQLAKGILDTPFVQRPPTESLPPISEVIDSDSSTEAVEYIDEDTTKVIYNNKKGIHSETEYLSQDNDYDKEVDSSRDFDTKTVDDKSSEATRQQTILCYTCPEMMRACVNELAGDQYEYRANNLIMRLRDIKKQNMLLHQELMALKEESKAKPGTVETVKVDNSTSVLNNNSTSTLKSLKARIQDFEVDKNNLSDTIASLQEQLDNFHELKRVEIEDMKAKHKLEVIKLKTSMRGESKEMYDEKLEDLKKYYDDLINDIKKNYELEMLSLKKRHHDSMTEKDKIIQETITIVQEKDKEVHEKLKALHEYENKLKEKDIIIQEKDKTIEETFKTIHEKDKEIAAAKVQAEDQTSNLQSMLQKFLEKPSGEFPSESMKIKAHELEKRLSKMEKLKSKCAKMYESKVAQLQREKHLAECSLQLQLVRQRAQVINEIADENQVELQTAFDKLETKYKDIVANVQATAIQRRMQDQIALDAILQAACGLRNEVPTNQSQFSGKTVTVKPKEENLSYDSEISGILRNKIQQNKYYTDEGAGAGYCLDGERFGELFEKIHIPQRDIGDVMLKK